MIHLARLRPRLTKLTFAWIWLGLASAAVSFASTYKLGQWITTTIWVTAAVLVALLFLLPALRYAATYVDVHSTGLALRLGLGRARRIELSWGEIATITASPLKGIVIRTNDDREFVLRGYSAQREIVAEMNSLLGGK